MNTRLLISGLLVALAAGAIVAAFLNTLDLRTVDLIASSAILLVILLLVVCCYDRCRRKNE